MELPIDESYFLNFFSSPPSASRQEKNGGGGGENLKEVTVSRGIFISSSPPGDASNNFGEKRAN